MSAENTKTNAATNTSNITTTYTPSCSTTDTAAEVDAVLPPKPKSDIEKRFLENLGDEEKSFLLILHRFAQNCQSFPIYKKEVDGLLHCLCFRNLSVEDLSFLEDWYNYSRNDFCERFEELCEKYEEPAQDFISQMRNHSVPYEEGGVVSEDIINDIIPGTESLDDEKKVFFNVLCYLARISDDVNQFVSYLFTLPKLFGLPLAFSESLQRNKPEMEKFFEESGKGTRVSERWKGKESEMCDFYAKICRVKFNKQRLGFFWDVENLNKGYNIALNIRKKLFFNYVEVRFIGTYSPNFVKNSKEEPKSNKMTKYIHSDNAMIDARKIESEKSNANDAALVEEMKKFASENPPPSALVLIANDEDYVDVVKDLSDKGHAMTVILTLREMSKKWKNLLKDRDQIKVYDYNEFSDANEKMILTNIPDNLAEQEGASDSNTNETTSRQTPTNNKKEKQFEKRKVETWLKDKVMAGEDNVHVKVLEVSKCALVESRSKQSAGKIYRKLKLESNSDNIDVWKAKHPSL